MKLCAKTSNEENGLPCATPSYGNGTDSTRSFTGGGLLKTLQYGNGGDPGACWTTGVHYHEGVANNGRIMQITDHNDASRTQSYTYDGFYRLATAETQGPHWGLSFTYDRYGNRLSQSATKGSPPTHTATVDAYSNRITAWSYDEAGNVLDDTRHSYAFDANNKIVSMDSGAAAYAYDAQGSRVKKTVGGVTTYYFWGHEYISGWSKLHIFLGGRKLAEYSAGTTHFFHLNHLGTPVARTDVGGTQDATWSHYPFGEEWTSSGPTDDQQRFSGYMRDGESDNDYAEARYHNVAAGRWLGADELAGVAQNPQTLQRFAFSLNDPVNYVDSDGRTALAWCTSTWEQRLYAEIHGMSPWRCTQLLNNGGPPAEAPQAPPGESGEGGGGSLFGDDDRIFDLVENPCTNAVLPGYSLLYGNERDILGPSPNAEDSWNALSRARKAGYLNIIAAMEHAGILVGDIQVDWQRGISQDRIHLFASGVTEDVLLGRGFTRFTEGSNSFREGVAFGSLEVTLGAAGSIEVDIDYYNPLQGQLINHQTREVIPNWWTESLTNPFSVYSILHGSIGRPRGAVRPQYQCDLPPE